METPLSPIRIPADVNAGYFEVIDQRRLPFELVWTRIETWQEAETAIRDMCVRGAPLIGLTAAYGLWLAAGAVESSANALADFQEAVTRLRAARPTAVNLMWAVDRMAPALSAHTQNPVLRTEATRAEADAIFRIEFDACEAIGRYGLDALRPLKAGKNGEPLRLLTHCNAGWLACAAWGTATAPMYMARREGLPLHVWVDETRPRNQGAYLTAWELSQAGVDCTLISDNSGGHLMRAGLVDAVIVGADRVTRNGDVANKIGTYLKALAARDNGIPFYVALPMSTYDPTLAGGDEIEIELRSEDETLYVFGRTDEGAHKRVLIAPDGVRARNDAFDVTPARLVTGYITEKGVARNPVELYLLHKND